MQRKNLLLAPSCHKDPAKDSELPFRAKVGPALCRLCTHPNYLSVDNLVVSCEGQHVVVGLPTAGSDQEDAVSVPVREESSVRLLPSHPGPEPQLAAGRDGEVQAGVLLAGPGGRHQRAALGRGEGSDSY